MTSETLTDSVSQKDIEKNMSNKERVMRALQSWGTNEVYANLSDIAAKTGSVQGAPSITEKQVYFSIYALSQEGKLEIMTEHIGDSQRKQFAGVKLVKAEKPESMTERAAEKVKVNRTDRSAEKVRERYPQILAYAEKKLVVERARKMLMDAGLPQDSVHFNPDPMAEEGISILGELVEALQHKIQLEADLSAAKSDIKFLKEQRHQPVTN